MENNLLIDINNNILSIKFNRPESRNAITRDMFEKLLKTLEDYHIVHQQYTIQDRN